MAEDTIYARGVFNAIKEASKAAYKTGFTEGGVTYSINYTTRTITGTFSFPLEESEDLVTGGINFEVANFLQDPTPTIVP
ncbi:hypothetical protein [Synechocystis sp. PCC 7509]|uniref:hypothetical protein n=1 Tax=Synechocystis sp. PCC 7509 TaxID=927677 RepID=UPI0002ACA825|nr:hypothetical protein [Synechocystis sp. PCC 7509]